MATKTITISAVESRFENYYREDQSTGNIVLYATYLLCPTAITAPYLVTGFTYSINVNCVDSADSSITYSYTGTYPGSSILEFTTHRPGAAEGTWKDAYTYPSGRPEGGTCYLAIDEDNWNLSPGSFVTYELSGTITFTYSEVKNYNIANTASNVQYKATLQSTGTTTTPGTNKLSFGNTAPKSLYYGSSPVQKVYLGSTLLYSTPSTPTTEYGINIQLLGPSVSLDDSMYTSVKINGVTLEIDTEKKVGSTQLTVSVVSGSLIAPTTIDIYAWIPGDQTDVVCTRARINGYLKCSSSTVVKATWSWSDIIVATW